MRLNKKRLAALAMSAVMAASAVPFPVYAEELSAGEDVVVAETTVEPIAEEVTEAPEVGAATGKVVGVRAYYDWASKTLGIKYDIDNLDNENDPVVEEEHYTMTFHDATCTADEYVVIEYDGKGLWKQAETFKSVHENSKAEHKYEYHWKQTKAPTCTEEGVETKYRRCINEDCTVDEPVPSTDLDNYEAPKAIPAKHAAWTSEETRFVVDETAKNDEQDNAWNTKINKETGKVELVNPKADGQYQIVYTCSKCGKDAVKETVHLDAAEFSNVTVVTDTKGDYAAENIKDINQVVTAVAGDSANLPLSDKKVATIELKDCSKPGSFFVTYTYNGRDFYKKYEVAAHHFKTTDTIVVAKDDAAFLNVTKNEDGVLEVENTSCSKAIEYTVVTHCVAAGCDGTKHVVDTKKFVELNEQGEVITKNETSKVVNTKSETAEPTGDHLLADVTKDIDKLIEKGGKIRFSELYLAAQNSKAVAFDVPENVCELGGVVTVKYLCQRCDDVVKTTDVTVYPESHNKNGKTTVENEVKATCQEKGHKDLVTHCLYCNAEVDRVTVEEPKLAHTNADLSNDEGAYITFVGDKVVDNNGECLDVKPGTQVGGQVALASGKTFRYVGTATDNNKATEFGVYPTIRTNCTECGKNEVILTNKVTNRDSIKLELVSVKKQDAKGQNGSITLKATYTLTSGKNAGKEITTDVKFPYYSSMEAYTGRTEPEVKDGLYKDEDGVYRYYVNGELQKDFTGIIDYAGNKYLIAAGELATDVSGLWYSEADKVWYFLVEGGVRTDYTGTALYDGEWFYVSNGRLNESINGLVPYNGGTFLFIEGRLRTDVSGLWQDINNPDDWYFLALGQVQNQYSGVAMYDGGFFVVKNGKFDKDYNGTIKYDGKTFKVVGGQLVIK